MSNLDEASTQEIDANEAAERDRRQYRAQAARERARQTFRHYMSMFYRATYGREPDPDNFVEWDGILDDVIEAAKG